MKTLIVHPKDTTTTFLLGIYKALPDKTVITGGITRARIRELIDKHDRVIFCGHGSPWGLFSVYQFPEPYVYIIDESMVALLKDKTNNIFIWCHADQYVKRYNLTGFYSGMFISELPEAENLGFEDIKYEDIEESNYRFVEIISRHINEDINEMYRNVMNEYGILAGENQVARYNLERLYLKVVNLQLKVD